MTNVRNNRVLVIDDNRAIHDDIRKILASNAAGDPILASIEDAIFGDGEPAAAATEVFTIESAFQGEDGFAKAKQARLLGNPYSVAFVDMRMPPGWDGLRTVREIWQCDPDLNIVVCTAFSDHSWADIEALDEAGDRLLVLKKPFEPIEVRRLAATLTAKWSLTLEATLKRAQLEHLVDERTLELHTAATHDRLTGLPNRTLLYDRLTLAMAARKRLNGGDLAVLFLDFDRFKIVNDSLGHAGGDELLKCIAVRLATALRETDSVTRCTGLTARLGGDEFCILLTGLRKGAQDAASVATRLLDVLAEPYDILGCRIQSTASIGIALDDPRYTSADEIIRDADTAMYRAKSLGKGRFVLFDTKMHEQAMARLTLEMELRKALAGDELELHYQPLVDVSTLQVVGAEALVRWRHPSRGLVFPADFISLAEESGLICQLGMFVLTEASEQLAQWTRAYPHQKLHISINVSTKQLGKPEFLTDAAAIISKSGVDPKALILEITETDLIGDMELAAKALSGLQEMGMRLFLDDFGTGYSSLSLLRFFRLDGLKIDRSFIQEGTTRRESAEIIRAVSGLAHNLNMEIVAEGIESQAQLALLERFGCQKAQGYYFSKAIPPLEFEQRFLIAAGKLNCA